MEHPVHIGIMDANGSRLYSLSQEDLDLRRMSAKMDANRKAREAEMERQLAERNAQIKVYEAQRAEIQKENLRRVKALEAKKVRQIRMAKWFIACGLFESIMVCLWRFGACQPVVPLTTLALCGMVLSYQAGCLKSEVVQ